MEVRAVCLGGLGDPLEAEVPLYVEDSISGEAGELRPEAAFTLFLL